MKDLHELPKLRDSVGYIFVEHAIVEQNLKSISIHRKDGTIQVPVCSLGVLLLGPGTSITHEAIKTLSENGCSVLWCGENMVRFYASGIGETRKSNHIIHQAELVSNKETRLQVVRKMYCKRFSEKLDKNLTIEQLRGKEGVRVRTIYAQMAKETGIKWSGRSYDRKNWYNSDPINQALSIANSCLYGICHAAIVSGGYSAALGFIHTGKQLSFVYDIADLYKVDLTIPLSFRLVAESTDKLSSRVRHECRDIFHKNHLMGRILSDIDELLDLSSSRDEDFIADYDPAFPSELWNPDLEVSIKSSYDSDKIDQKK